MLRYILAALMIVALTALVFGSDGGGVDRRSTVKIVLPSGHGSGVHIGDGYILTAAHVTRGNKDITIKASNGEEIPAVVLWESTEYDVALLRVDDTRFLGSAHLSCRVAQAGEAIAAHGNPLFMERIITHGTVSGAPVKVERIWASVLPLSLPVAGGMSGGGLFDASGHLVGIIVGFPLQPLGFGMGTMVGISFAVDARTICNLLARG